MNKIIIMENDEKIFESSWYSEYENEKVVDFKSLHNANLQKADLRHIDLSYIDLRHVDLSGADLRYAKLCGADLRYAKLCGADLSHVNLFHADLHHADLHYADLSDSDLLCADLQEADLHKADLRHADLQGADLHYADLSDTDLSGADLYHTRLDEKEQKRKGFINKEKTIVYKKCQGKIVELELQKDSIVFSINNKKCRTNMAKVISIDGKKEKGLKIVSDYDAKFIYETGKIISVDDFSLIYNIECAEGIHFYYDKEYLE